MTRDLLVARLVAMRAMLDAWILEATETEACCDKPSLQTVETYGQSETRCLSCGTITKAGSDKVRGAVNSPDETRGEENGRRQS